MGAVSAFSGGKDSTAMVLRQAELGESFSLLFTPTGNELPELFEHLHRVAGLCGAPLIVPPGPQLIPLIRLYNALPNCTGLYIFIGEIPALRRLLSKVERAHRASKPKKATP